METQLHQHKVLLASTTADVRLAAVNQGQTFSACAAQIQQLTTALAQSTTLPSSPAPSSPHPLLHQLLLHPRKNLVGGVPECCAGVAAGCNPFIMNCSILFTLQTHTFASEDAKVAFTINHLKGHAQL